MKFSLKIYGLQEIGQRKRQEDSIFPPLETLNDQARLFILCDGMGGHEAGDVASSTVCSAMGEYILNKIPDNEAEFTDDDFKQALNHAYDALDARDNNETEKKMGTTMTFLKFHKDGCTIAHMGDSRVYHIRSGKDIDDTEILFQTIDHSLVNDLIKLGELTSEEAKNFDRRNVITRALQPHAEHRYRADIYHTRDIQPGDYFLMCSDGILENIEDDNLKYIFADRGGDAAKKINMLKKITAQNNDNHSAILVYVCDVQDREESAPPMVADDRQSEGVAMDPVGGGESGVEPPDQDNSKDFDANFSKDSNPLIPSWMWILLIFIILPFVGYKIYNFSKEKTEDSEPRTELPHDRNKHPKPAPQNKPTNPSQLQQVSEDKSPEQAEPLLQEAPVKPVKEVQEEKVEPHPSVVERPDEESDEQAVIVDDDDDVVDSNEQKLLNKKREEVRE